MKLLPFWVFVFAFCLYLCFRLSKIQKLRSLFERTAVQNAVDLIDSMKKVQNQVPEAHQPKLITKGKIILMISCLCVGSGLYLFRGHLTGVAIFSSAIAFVIGVTILFFIIKYVNKPKNDQ